MLIAFFYVELNWFAPERTSSAVGSLIYSGKIQLFTGLLTLDGLLNKRPDISLDALRHLVMPVFTLAIAHWATLGRITRASMIEELQQEYVVAARSRGLHERWVIWRHALRNAISPALASSLVSAASLVTGVFVVEIIFNFHGFSEIAVKSMAFIADAPSALGFAIYSVLVVSILMGFLDLAQSVLDPRIRGGDCNVGI
jgi:peptide/nickel transport system permease protein